MLNWPHVSLKDQAVHVTFPLNQEGGPQKLPDGRIFMPGEHMVFGDRYSALALERHTDAFFQMSGFCDAGAPHRAVLLYDHEYAITMQSFQCPAPGIKVVTLAYMPWAKPFVQAPAQEMLTNVFSEAHQPLSCGDVELFLSLTQKEMRIELMRAVPRGEEIVDMRITLGTVELDSPCTVESASDEIDLHSYTARIDPPTPSRSLRLWAFMRGPGGGRTVLIKKVSIVESPSLGIVDCELA